MLKYLLVSLLAFPACVFAAQNGFGAGPAVPASEPLAAPAEPPVYAFEPWIKSAVVGDFVEQKYAGGYLIRSEVKEISDKFVIVECKTTHNGKDGAPYSKKYERTPSGNKNLYSEAREELEMKKASVSSVTIGGQTVKTEVWDGYVKGIKASMNNVERCKITRFQKVVAEDVPLGGVVKQLIAKDDGKPLDFKGKAGQVKNTNTTLVLLWEVTAYGRGERKK